MKAQRVRIVSDGTVVGTRVELEDGTPVAGVVAVHFSAEGIDTMAKATLVFDQFDAELVAEVDALP